MLTTNPQTNNIQLIIDALAKKSKKTLSYKQTSLKRQAYYFSPAYRDFIVKIIKNNSLKILHNNYESYIESCEDGEIYAKLTKRKKSYVYADINDPTALPHELGHAVDFWFGRQNSLSKTVIIFDNKTLYDIFTEEFESKYEELYQLVMNEYRDIINKRIKEDAYDIIINNISRYRELKSIPINLKDKDVTKKRRKIQQELYDDKFVETYYELLNSFCYSSINKKYLPILDALSSKYDLSYLCLDSHYPDYYRFSKYRPVYEFFANLFEAKMTSRHEHFDYLIKYLPKSFNAFEKLFVIFYDHIQNNKRFTDVELNRK